MKKWYPCTQDNGKRQAVLVDAIGAVYEYAARESDGTSTPRVILASRDGQELADIKGDYDMVLADIVTGSRTST